MMETRFITRLNVEIKNQNREVRLKYDLTSFDLRALISIKPRDFFVMTWYSSFQPIIAPSGFRKIFGRPENDCFRPHFTWI